MVMVNASRGDLGETSLAYDPRRGFPRVVAELLYEDTARAIDWLSRVFGFVEQLRFSPGGGRVLHAELELEQRILMLGPLATGRAEHGAPPPAGLRVRFGVTDSRALLVRVRAEGAQVLAVWGRASRPSFDVLDCEEHLFRFEAHSALAR